MDWLFKFISRGCWVTLLELYVLLFFFPFYNIATILVIILDR